GAETVEELEPGLRLHRLRPRLRRPGDSDQIRLHRTVAFPAPVLPDIAGRVVSAARPVAVRALSGPRARPVAVRHAGEVGRPTRLDAKGGAGVAGPTPASGPAVGAGEPPGSGAMYLSGVRVVRWWMC